MGFGSCSLQCSLPSRLPVTPPNLHRIEPETSCDPRLKNWASEFKKNVSTKYMNLALSTSLAIALSLTAAEAAGAKPGVNKPELLPKEYTSVIDVAGFLSDGQEKRLAQEIEDIERDTGYKLRVLAQNYPDTPGLAIRDYWKVDERTVVFVADPTFGNLLHFNVGDLVDLNTPKFFWSRLEGKYGNVFYWKDKGEDAAIEATVNAIGYCLREPAGSSKCSEVK